MPSSTRRRVLRAVATGVTIGLAGCAVGRHWAGRPTVTPAPVPPDRPSLTPESPDGRPPSPDVLEFEVRVLTGFSEASPARLEIGFRNAGNAVITALDGPAHTVPFVDDDSVGTDWSGDPEVLLVPDDARMTVDPAGAEPGPIHEFLPQSPTDGCWSVPFDWSAARRPSNAGLHAISLQPGECRRHEYGLYYLDGCTTGTFSFVNTFDLAAGDPPFGRDLVRARLGFDVAISEVMEPLVRVHDPVIEASAGGD